MFPQTPPYNDRSQAAYNGHTIPVGYPKPQRHIPWLMIGAYLAAFLGVAIGAVCLTLLLSYKATAETQIHSAQSQVRAMSQALNGARSANQGNYNNLNGKLDAIASVLAPYNMSCSQDLTGPQGPATFYFLCTDTKP